MLLASNGLIGKVDSFGESKEFIYKVGKQINDRTMVFYYASEDEMWLVDCFILKKSSIEPESKW